jgi:Tol biopolymer transport system component
MRASSLVSALLACWLAAAPPARADEATTAGLRYPSLTPDGKSVVFCYRGDVWIAPADGSSHADRLTIHEEQDTLSRVSPDGKQIAFSSKRFGNYDLFLIPIDGGVPKQVTFHSAFEALCEWSPDGKRLLFASERDADAGRTDLYEVDPAAAGTPRRITFDGGREGSYSPDGTRIVYVRGFHNIYWDRYKGAANFDVYVIDAKGGTPRRLTETDGNERWPFFSADGQTVYFQAEEGGTKNFYSVPLAGGAATQVTKFKGPDLHRPDLAWDFRTAVFPTSPTPRPPRRSSRSASGATSGTAASRCARSPPAASRCT